MKKALIQLPSRVCQVEDSEFPVASPLFWVDCDDTTTPETHIYDGVSVVLKPVPIPTQEELRKLELETALKSDTILSNLRSMTNQQYNAWFDTNITNASQAITLLKRILRVLIVRVL